jgi:hypothetical protein
MIISTFDPFSVKSDRLLGRVGPHSVIWNDRRIVVETCAPKLTAPDYIGGDIAVRSVSGIHLPLSSDGEMVDKIFTFAAYDTRK